MTTAISELKASYAFIERNFNIVKRYWAWELVWLVYTVANSLAVSYIGLGVVQLGGKGVDGKFLVLYLAVGTIVWRYLSVIFYWVTDVVGLERWEGTIEYTLMAPITRLMHMAGQTAFAVVYSLIHTGVVLLATMLFFDISLAHANLWGFLLLLAAGSLSFIGISIFGSVLPLLFPERGSQMTHLIIAVLLLSHPDSTAAFLNADQIPKSPQPGQKFGLHGVAKSCTLAILRYLVTLPALP